MGLGGRQPAPGPGAGPGPGPCKVYVYVYAYVYVYVDVYVYVYAYMSFLGPSKSEQKIKKILGAHQELYVREPNPGLLVT